MKQKHNKENREGKVLTITVKTFFGLEKILQDELVEMGYTDVFVLNRAVHVKGDWNDVYFLNYNLRCAISVLVEIANFELKHPDDLYKNCLQIDWTSFFDINKTFAIKGAIFSDLYKHSQFPFLVVKDAIADSFRKKHGERPDVNVKKPQVLFDLYIRNNSVTISLNSSGAPLYQRGYRQEAGIAPLNEVLAAALIRISGWDRKSTFFDPFCGSGTLLIEAALMAAELPPMIERQHFAFKNFANYNEEKWLEITGNVTVKTAKLPCRIIGSDISAEMVTKTRRNLRGLAIGRFVETSVETFQNCKKPDENGIMISNPPYGERMGEEIEELYESIGNWMKKEMSGFDCWILSSNMEAFKFIGLKPEDKVKVYNGDLECSFRKYAIFEGSQKDMKKQLNQEKDKHD